MKPKRLELAATFLKVGALGFGGPFASIRMMEEEVVHRRRWISSERVNRWMATCKLLPGPIATQVAIGLGQDLLGWQGGMIAGVSLILPAALLVGGASWAYFGDQAWMGTFRDTLHSLWVLPLLTWALLPASAAQILKSLGRVTPLVVVCFGVGALGTALHPKWELMWLLVAGLIAWVVEKGRAAGWQAGKLREVGSVSLALVALVHVLAGAFTFGSGFAVVPLLKSRVVDQLGWLSTSQFLDGVLLGQVTPGPVVITATFVGWGAAGFWGSVAATLGIFAPAFFNMLTWVPRIQNRLDRSRSARTVLDGLVPAVAGSLLGLAIHMRDIVFQVGVVRGSVIALILVAALTFTRRSALTIGLAAVAALKLYTLSHFLFS